MKKVIICGICTSDLPRLSSKESEEMMRKIKDGDNAARKRFIQCNLRLVLSVLQRFDLRCESSDDLFQVGCIGMIKAIDNFDLKHNVKFSTYAVPVIIGEIRRYLRDNNSIRVSRSLKDIAYKALRAKEELSAANNREPTILEIANHIDVLEEDVVIALEAIQMPVSFYEPVYQDSGDSIYLLEQIKDNKNDDKKWVEYIDLEEAMKKLTKKEKSIIDMRFYQGKTQSEVAEDIGISQAQVSRLEKNALNRIKSQI
ncbi:MAG: RNA polymerase sporulation sigma factor SigG [Eubacteriaceae bacterium]|nr:RNA polymerase sporulation sigma factor SigG [Eubacteriaceae bacterium]